MTCTCTEPGWCPHYQKHLTGRLWEIAKGINIDPETAEKYRALWARLAGLTERPVVDTTKRCGC